MIRGPLTGMGADCEPVLRDLPEWFGVESAILQYRRDIEQLPTWLARMGDELAGFITIKQHNPYSAEILVMGVRPCYHRSGIGRTLVREAEANLKRKSVQFLQVKTLSSLRPDEGYARTRAFYFAMGFRPLEELSGFWDEENPCLQLVKSLV